jgi:integrase
MRIIGKLTAIQVTRLPPPAPRANGAQRNRLVGDGAGLWLQITSTNVRTWVYRYRLNGRARAHGLGALHTVSLQEARIRARACRLLVLDGLDPIEVRKAKLAGERIAAAKMMTFEQAASAYIASHRAGWRSRKHTAEWSSSLAAYVHPVIGSLPVQAVDVTLVMRALEPIWTSKPETAGRVRGRIEAILDYATARGYRTDENPARWKGHLENLLPAKRAVRRVEHHPALAYVEMPAFISQLRQTEGVAPRALEFAILTAARTGEVLGARWDEFDLTARLWTLPAVRTKSGREHRVPLSEPALALLKGLERSTGAKASSRLFPIGSRGLLNVLRRMHPNATPHGFRSTFADWCTEQTSFPTEVREMALAHAVGSKVEAAYRRSDLFEKRRQLAEAWARFCAGGDGGKVIELRTAAG